MHAGRVGHWALVVLLLGSAGCLATDEDLDGAGTDVGDETPEESPTSEPAPLPRTEWSFDPGPGCEGSTTGQGTCASFIGGPPASGIDGYWVELGEIYWGRSFETTIEQPDGGVDSDCYFVAGDETTILENANQGGDPCSGTVVEETAWLFLYSYQIPQLGMTLSFAE